jgi:mannose-6-phosphate isomerase-like protein (cupin superfamily)
VNKGGELSLQSHRQKDETLMVWSGGAQEDLGRLTRPASLFRPGFRGLLDAAWDAG